MVGLSAPHSGVMLSLHPRHAKNVLSGRKTVEVRRFRGRVNSGDLVFIYVSSPVKALVGRCLVSRVLHATPDYLWKVVGPSVALSREEFDSYLANSRMGFAIFLRKVEPYSHPVPLDSLRRHLPGFHPPQTYLYLPRDARRRLSSLLDVQDSGASECGHRSATHSPAAQHHRE